MMTIAPQGDERHEGLVCKEICPIQLISAGPKARDAIDKLAQCASGVVLGAIYIWVSMNHASRLPRSLLSVTGPPESGSLIF